MNLFLKLSTIVLPLTSATTLVANEQSDFNYQTLKSEFKVTLKQDLVKYFRSFAQAKDRGFQINTKTVGDFFAWINHQTLTSNQTYLYSNFAVFNSNNTSKLFRQASSRFQAIISGQFFNNNLSLYFTNLFSNQALFCNEI